MHTLENVVSQSIITSPVQLTASQLCQQTLKVSFCDFSIFGISKQTAFNSTSLSHPLKMCWACEAELACGRHTGRHNEGRT